MITQCVNGVAVEITGSEEAEIRTEWSASAVVQAATAYIRNRTIHGEARYPTVTDQLDMLFHEMTASGSLTTSGSWYQTIKSIKEANPKP